MTTKQQDQLSRALDRAYAAGLDIIGQGRMRNGNRFFLVPSVSEPGTTHVVVSDDQHLHCDCHAGAHDLICQHRALAHEYLTHEAAKRAAQAAEVQRALDTTLAALGPKPHTSTRAFSCFK